MDKKRNKKKTLSEKSPVWKSKQQHKIRINYIDLIESSHIATIINSYIDFFSRKEVIDQIHNMIHSDFPKEEKGGLVVFDKVRRFYPIT